MFVFQINKEAQEAKGISAYDVFRSVVNDAVMNFQSKFAADYPEISGKTFTPVWKGGRLKVLVGDFGEKTEQTALMRDSLGREINFCLREYYSERDENYLKNPYVVTSEGMAVDKSGTLTMNFSYKGPKQK